VKEQLDERTAQTPDGTGSFPHIAFGGKHSVTSHVNDVIGKVFSLASLTRDDRQPIGIQYSWEISLVSQ
jgi:hypothetical protein